MPTVSIAQDAAANDLLGRDPLALVLGMLLDHNMRRRSSEAGTEPARRQLPREVPLAVVRASSP